jgi:MbtH protein
MTNPFEKANVDYTVLRNEEDQHSLWPAFADVPAGWTKVFGPDDREACMTYVRENWSDLRPRSVAAFVAEHAGKR